MKRRSFLKHGIATAGLAAMSQTALFAVERDSVIRSKTACLTVQFSNNRAVVLYDGLPWTDYCAFSSQKSPYFASIAGPSSGLPLTSTVLHPWCRQNGVSFGCDRIAYHHNSIDQTQKIRRPEQIVSQGLALGPCTSTRVEFYDKCLWQQPNRSPIIADERHFRLNLLSETAYTLDCIFELTPLTDLAMQPTGTSFLSLRAADDIAVSGGGKLLNVRGQTRMQGTFGQPAEWCTFFGKRRVLRDDLVEGIALLCPANPMINCRWLTRDYGLLVPHSLHFLKQTQQFYKGETLRFAYRIVAYTGPPDPLMLNRLCETPKFDVSKNKI